MSRHAMMMMIIIEGQIEIEVEDHNQSCHESVSSFWLYGDIFLELLSDNSLSLDLYTADELLWRQRQRCHGLLEQRCVGMDNRITAQCQC